MPSLALILAGAVLLAGARSAQADTPVRVALLPMVVHSAENPDYLRSGLSDMLSARLEQVKGLDIVRIDDVGAATTRLTAAVASGRKVEADFVLFGAFTRFGQGASLDVQCAATHSDGEAPPMREIFVHSGNIGEVIPDLETLVGKVTRFVIRDFVPLAAAPEEELGENNGGPPAPELSELQHRVEALEEALGRIEAASPTDANGDGFPTASTEASVR